MFRFALIIPFLLAQVVQAASPPSKQVSSPGSKPDAAMAVRVQLKAQQEARLASQMDGRIIAIPHRLGEAFRKGDLLVGFGCDHHQAALSAAQAQLVRALKTEESRQSLLKLQAVSELEVELARAEVATARSEVERVRAVVSDCRILAPYDGKVVKVHVSQWETVGRGASLIDIVRSGPLEVEALLPSSWMSWLKPGVRFRINVDELREDVNAELVAIGARIDPVSQTVPVRAKLLESLPGLLPGMSGNAHFEPR